MMGKLKDRKRWAALIVQYAKSGLAAHEWCTQNGVTQNQLGYRLRQAYTISENKPISLRTISLVSRILLPYSVSDRGRGRGITILRPHLN